MSTIKVSNIQNASTSSGGIAIDTSGHVTVDGVAYPSAGSLSGRNRIINGDMRIDQRNAGASVTAVSNAAQLDRWKTFFTGNGVFTVQQSTTVPNNTFSNSVVLTVATADSSITSAEDYGYLQFIEGYNIADFAWGSASATAITLSFWVRSSITGTWVASIYNSNGTRCYPATFSISVADTWQKISLNIPGDTGGTWDSANGVGMAVRIDLGSGSNLNGTANAWNTSGSYAGLRTTSSVNWIANAGATFYITGVQLEAGSVATPFERRSYGQELALCQRYYWKTYLNNTVAGSVSQAGAFMITVPFTGNSVRLTHPFKVQMRAAPTFTFYNPETGTAGYAAYEGSGATNQVAMFQTFTSEYAGLMYGTSAGFIGSLYWHAVGVAEL